MISSDFVCASALDAQVSKEERKRLKEALKAGRLHQELLDRRSKMKADKFCK
jgi:hypothetical protein